jgi:hypothetical protein
MKFKSRTIESIADMICGNSEDDQSFFIYRSSSQLTRFFHNCDTDYAHDGSTRANWVAGVIGEILAEPQPNEFIPSDTFTRVIGALMDQKDAHNEQNTRINALKKLNNELAREGYEAFYADDRHCYLRHIETNTVIKKQQNPNRPFSQPEKIRRKKLSGYLENSSEDELIEHILLPLFRQIGFHQVTATGHKDKSLEYGKDIWMKYTIPTQHVLYFGIQVKKRKLDASSDSKATTANIAEIYHQTLMMIGHEIFDQEISKRALVDHAFIISCGEITKAAKNWLGNRLDSTRRSQIMFIDKDKLLDLCIVTNLPLPNELKTISENEESLPF